MSAEHVIIWRYLVATDRSEAFERAYGASGPWVSLFGRHAGYRGTLLVRAARPGVYLTVDRWDSLAAFEAFRRDAAAEYDRLDDELAGLADVEELLERGEVR